MIGDSLQRYCVVRTAWLLGGGESYEESVSRIIHLATRRSESSFVNDRFAPPTYTRDLSLGCDTAHEDPPLPNLWMVDTGVTRSRCRMAQKIAEYTDFKTADLVPCSSAEYPSAAPRPRIEARYNYRLRPIRPRVMRRWQEASSEYTETVCAEE